MSRVQLALNVADLDASIDFYERLFATAPAKRRPGYANFVIADPPLKLVLFEQPDAEQSLNHLGVEVSSTEEVVTTRGRLDEQGLQGTDENQVTCCYAVQDKVWVDAPDGEPWEIYTVLADAEAMACGTGEGASPEGAEARGSGSARARACC